VDRLEWIKEKEEWLLGLKMRKILYLFSTLLLLWPILTGCNNSIKNGNSSLKPDISNAQESNTSEYKFAIYAVKNLSSVDITKSNIDKLTLENDPIITEKDISTYYWKSMVFKTNKSIFISKLNHAAGISGTPFVLTANGERIYLGTLWSPFSSAYPPKDTTILQIGSMAIGKLNKDGYNVTYQDNDVYFEISPSNDDKYKISDKRVYNALKDAGILKK
jgi:hypothetical protein